MGPFLSWMMLLQRWGLLGLCWAFPGRLLPGLLEYAILCCHSVAQSCPTLCDPHELQPARLLGLWGFSIQEYWNGLPCLPPGDLPNPGIEPRSPTLKADSLSSEPPGKPMLKPSMQDFKHDFTSMGNECNFLIVSTFFDTTFLGN